MSMRKDIWGNPGESRPMDGWENWPRSPEGVGEFFTRALQEACRASGNENKDFIDKIDESMPDAVRKAVQETVEAATKTEALFWLAWLAGCSQNMVQEAKDPVVTTGIDKARAADFLGGLLALTKDAIRISEARHPGLTEFSANMAKVNDPDGKRAQKTADELRDFMFKNLGGGR